jgi:hypothetical protein
MTHRCLLVILPESIANNNLVLSAMSDEFDQFSDDAADLSSSNKVYLMRKNVSEMSPGGIDYHQSIDSCMAVIEFTT